ncbi:hypothetical protein L1049_009581 [Liquidambar formosana]|uniref:Disease resistance R13L4/SHOC-2-like LRR domain-containing protein n=1 Tax=Liquidambar formosana TaxID=63359 RepID=A0AAP0N7H8_LIQFO
MPKGRIGFTSLQTLSGVESDEDLVKELKSLTNLRKLYIGRMTWANSKEFCVSLGEMRNLRSLAIISEDPLELQLESLSKPPAYLQKLKLQLSMSRLPKWIDSLNCLHTLYLFKNLLQEDPFPILQRLPSLVVLTMASSAFLSGPIYCTAQGFLKLKLLRILDMENWLKWMPIEEGTMPSLQYLLIANCPKLTRLPEGFHHLRALQDLTLMGMSTNFSYRLDGADLWKVSHVREVTMTQLGSKFVWRKSQ